MGALEKRSGWNATEEKTPIECHPRGDDCITGKKKNSWVRAWQKHEISGGEGGI